MSANRSRQHDKLEARRTINIQLLEHDEAGPTPDEDAHAIKEIAIEHERRRMIIDGVDPDSTPVMPFSYREDFEFALKEVGFVLSNEQELIDAVREKLPYEPDPWSEMEFYEEFHSRIHDDIIDGPLDERER